MAKETYSQRIAREDAESAARKAEEEKIKGLNNGTIRPEVGMGATNWIGTDGHAYHVIRVSPSGKTIWVQRAKAELVKAPEEFSPGGFVGHFSDNHSQEWKITPDADGTVLMCKITKHRGWHCSMGRMRVGAAIEFQNYNY